MYEYAELLLLSEEAELLAALLMLEATELTLPPLPFVLEADVPELSAELLVSGLLLKEPLVLVVLLAESELVILEAESNELVSLLTEPELSEESGPATSSSLHATAPKINSTANRNNNRRVFISKAPFFIYNCQTLANKNTCYLLSISPLFHKNKFNVLSVVTPPPTEHRRSGSFFYINCKKKGVLRPCVPLRTNFSTVTVKQTLSSFSGTLCHQTEIRTVPLHISTFILANPNCLTVST